MPLTARRLAVGVGTAALAGTTVLVGGLALHSFDHRAPEPAAAVAASGELLGPPLPTATVTGADGRSVTCPAGAEPTIYLEQATFAPRLVGGMQLAVRTYRITVRGRVVNETNSPIRVSSISWRVGGKVWPIRTTIPRTLAPGSAGAFAGTATFHSAHPQQAAVAGQLHWSWSDPQLRPCGTKGLIEDS